MDVRLIPIKIKQRLNKLNSSDYDNLEPWQIIEAFNKFQLQWVRGQLQGSNIRREGDESSIRKIDDLQHLLKSTELKGVNRDIYFESVTFPNDYLQFKRARCLASTDDCKRQRLVTHLVEEANIDIILDDPNTNPSFSWRETICTLIGDRIRVYTNDTFNIDELDLVYYRYPRPINLSGVLDINQLPGTNVDPEFNDDVVEILIDGAASILAGDIESINQYQRLEQKTKEDT